VTDRLHFHDPTSAMQRPQMITHFGPGEQDKLPERIRPLLSQVVICVVGWVVMFCAWAFIFQGFLLPDGVAVAVCFGIPVVAARYHRRINVDGRNVFRAGRSEIAHRAKSGGRSVGRWHVHGEPVPQTRRPPKPGKSELVPVEELTS
jgi:hypothetical protein